MWQNQFSEKYQWGRTAYILYWPLGWYLCDRVYQSYIITCLSLKTKWQVGIKQLYTTISINVHTGVFCFVLRTRSFNAIFQFLMIGSLNFMSPSPPIPHYWGCINRGWQQKYKDILIGSWKCPGDLQNMSFNFLAMYILMQSS